MADMYFIMADRFLTMVDLILKWQIWKIFPYLLHYKMTDWYFEIADVVFQMADM